jgi:rare lipoprotein A
VTIPQSGTCLASALERGGRSEQRWRLGGREAHRECAQRRLGRAWIATYYGQEFAGRRTASGEKFNPSAMTAAHRTLPFGTRVRVTNSRNGRSIIVRINDRGPFVKGRSIDLSSGAARAIGMASTADVRIEVIR